MQRLLVAQDAKKNECFIGHFEKEYLHQFLYGPGKSMGERLKRMQDLEKGCKAFLQT